LELDYYNKKEVSKITKLSKYLKEYREANLLSISQLSRITGVSQPYLSQIENDGKIPSVKTIEKISKAMAGDQFLSVPKIFKEMLELAGYNPAHHIDEYKLLPDDIKEIASKNDEEEMRLFKLKMKHYPDLREFLTHEYSISNNIYYNKRKLDEDTIKIIIKVIDALTDDLIINYPSDSEILSETEHL